MMSNLYNVLGVEPDASTEEIAKQYRKLAREHHPDAGGEPARFKEISAAYQILKDDGARCHYDRTGNADECSHESQVLASIATYLNQSIQSVLSDGRDPEKRDILSMMRASVKKDREKCLALIKESERTAAKLRAVAARFSTSVSENPLKSILDQEARGLERQAATAEHGLKLADECAAILEDYDYRFDKDMSWFENSHPWRVVNSSTWPV